MAVHGVWADPDEALRRDVVARDFVCLYRVPADEPGRRVEAHGLFKHHAGIGQLGEIILIGRAPRQD